jgi:hypothetical protein
MVSACGGTAEQASSTVAPSATTSVAPITTSRPVTTTTMAVPTTTTASATTTTIAGPQSPWDTWTLVFASLDTAINTKDDAIAIAATVEDAAVLLSDDYPSLNPGYWIVYAGEWQDRAQAGIWCPEDLDPSLSCYPRYLGERTTEFLAADYVVAQLVDEVVILDPNDGSVQATISGNFHVEGEYPGLFALDRARSRLYFSLGFEDSWYSCESEQGQIRRLDLVTGVEEVFADGWSPAISPDGRWLAVVAAGGCYPDPDVDSWVMAPGSQVEIFDLADDSMSPVNTISLQQSPTSYGDEDQVHFVVWDADSTDLLVDIGDGTMRRVRRDTTDWLTDAPVEFETGDPFLAAATAESFYILNYYEDLYVLTVVDRATNEVVETREIPGWYASVAVNARGEVLIGGSDLLVLPSGEEISLDGAVYNLAW